MVAVSSKYRVSQKSYTGFFRDDKSENRLINASNSTHTISYSYDYMGRRFSKIVDGVTNTFVYDGWAMIREESATTTNHYVYGLDLSGSMQGAGTIGGILTADLNGTTAFYCYDANGNVTDLVDTNGTSVAHYEYGPFGQTTAKTGTLADDNPFRFSTKYLDDETALYYYGYRYYNPELGRWASRDPLGNGASDNLYGFVENEPSGLVDPLGLLSITSSLNGARDCGIVIWMTHCSHVYSALSGASDFQFPVDGCHRAAFVSCFSANRVPQLMAADSAASALIVPGYTLSTGMVGTGSSSGENGGMGGGLAGFISYFNTVLGEVKAYAETLCPPDDWEGDDCKDCDTYRANASGSQSGWLEYDYDRWGCCHCEDIEVKLILPFPDDQTTWGNILGSGVWTAQVGMLSGSTITYDCETDSW